MIQLNPVVICLSYT